MRMSHPRDLGREDVCTCVSFGGLPSPDEMKGATRYVSVCLSVGAGSSSSTAKGELLNASSTLCQLVGVALRPITPESESKPRGMEGRVHWSL